MESLNSIDQIHRCAPFHLLSNIKTWIAVSYSIFNKPHIYYRKAGFWVNVIMLWWKYWFELTPVLFMIRNTHFPALTLFPQDILCDTDVRLTIYGGPILQNQSRGTKMSKKLSFEIYLIYLITFTHICAPQLKLFQLTVYLPYLGYWLP